MPLSREVRRLGGKWPAIVERVESFVETMPQGGMPLAAFGEAALADVSPVDVAGIVKALVSRKAIWLRQGRGEALVFAKRPRAISGLLGRTDAAEVCLAECVPHLCAVTNAVERRDYVKALGDYVSASIARERIDIACIRLVEVVRKHVDRGLSLDAFCEALWRNWVPGTLQTIASFEPALALGSKAALTPAEAKPRRRITSGLSAIEKVAALIAKAGREGVTKTGLRRSIKPKLNGEELGGILDRLAAEGRVEARKVRIAVNGKPGTRYFVGEALSAA